MPDSAAVQRQHRGEHLAAAFPPLLVAAERVANTVVQGVHGRRRTGQGETFWQFRSYAPGDPVTRIDWRASAKSTRLYVRETEWEAAQSVWLWRDASPSMDYSSAPSLPTKRERAEILLLALASLLLRGGERLTLLNSGEPPGSGRAALTRLAHRLDAASPSLPDYEMVPRHGQIVLIGDLLSPLFEIEALISRFAQRGTRGHLLQILDPAEATLPFNGRVRFEGLEGETPLIMSRAEAVREAYIEKLAHHRNGLAETARLSRWTLATHRTDAPPQHALLGLYNALTAERGVG